MHFKVLLFLITLGSGGFPASGAFASCADLALVLAIDGSGSINDQDYSLQRQGYAAAFRDSRVQAALASAGVVDVAVVVWGDESMSPQVLPWQRIDSASAAAGFADRIAGLPRRVTGNTAMGNGLWKALDLLEASMSCAARRIINVSGDGKQSVGPRPRHFVALEAARSRADRMGVTINALAITLTEPDLPGWYQGHLIIGPDAFVMTVTSFDTFGEAIIRKLAREIGLPALAAVDMGREEWR